MEAIDKKNVRLVLLLGTACVASWFASRALLWWLADVQNHTWAYLLYLMAALTSCASALALDAFATVLRYGFARAGKGVMPALCAALHGAVRVVCAFYQGMFVVINVFDSIVGGGLLIVRFVGPLLLAAVAAGYGFLFRLEKRMKAQRARRVTFE